MDISGTRCIERFSSLWTLKYYTGIIEKGPQIVSFIERNWTLKMYRYNREGTSNSVLYREELDT